MSAFILGRLFVKNWDWYKEYRSATEALVAKHGGQYLVKGGNAEHLEGEADAPEAFVLIEFPSKQAAINWYNDPQYAPMIALRRKAGVATDLSILEGVPSRS